MGYLAKVSEVAIVSPSDVLPERDIAREVIRDWNSANSRARNVVLVPISFDEDVAPRMGERPQEIVNAQLIDRADYLIAIFWCRLGTPTGTSESGTVEEITRFIDSGRPVSIYFCTKDVPHKVDTVQLEALRAFQSRCMAQGIVQEFRTLDDLRKRLGIHIAAFAHEVRFDSELAGQVIDSANGSALSPEARILICAAARDPHAHIVRRRRLGGEFIQVGNKNYIPDMSARTLAKWHEAVDELESLSLIRDVGYQREIYEVTSKGFSAADLLASLGAPVAEGAAEGA